MRKKRLKDYRRYRAGSYRILAGIDQEEVKTLIVSAGRRIDIHKSMKSRTGHWTGA